MSTANSDVLIERGIFHESEQSRNRSSIENVFVSGGEDNDFSDQREVVFVRVRLHITMDEDTRDMLKKYVSIRKVLGSDVSDGEILEEALEVYGLRRRCEEESKNIHKMFIRKSG